MAEKQFAALREKVLVSGWVRGRKPSAAGWQLVTHNRQNGAATHTYDASAMAAHPQGFESNVVPFPEPPAKTLSADAAGPFTFAVWAATKVGGDALESIWRDELVVIDPDAALENNWLVVVLFDRGRPHTVRWRRTGRDQYGRFVPASDPRECFLLDCRLQFSAEMRVVRILGRVIGKPRAHCPRQRSRR